jgi:hypothetical protein
MQILRRKTPKGGVSENGDIMVVETAALTGSVPEFKTANRIGPIAQRQSRGLIMQFHMFMRPS